MTPTPRHESSAANSGRLGLSLLRLLAPLLLWGCSTDVDNLAFYVSDDKTPGRDEGAYAYDVFEGTSRLLLAGRVSELLLSPDGQRLALMHGKPGDRNNSIPRVISVADGHEVASGQDWSPVAWLGNDHLLETVETGGSYSFVRRNLDGSGRRVLFETKIRTMRGPVSVSPDGRTLVWMESVIKYGADTLCSLDVDSGVLSQTAPMGEAANVLGSEPIFLPDGNIGWTNLDSTALSVSDRAFKQIKRRLIAEEADILSNARLEPYVDNQILISRYGRSRFNVLGPGPGLMQPLAAFNEAAGRLQYSVTVQISRARTFACFSGFSDPAGRTLIFTRPDGSDPRPAPPGISFFEVR